MNGVVAWCPEIALSATILLLALLPFLAKADAEGTWASRTALAACLALPFLGARFAEPGPGRAAAVVGPALAALFLLPSSFPGRSRPGAWLPELPLLVLTLLLGGLVAARAPHGGILLLGVETMAFSGYAVAGIVPERKGQAAALRYALLGAVVTGVAALGWAFLLGLRGGLDLDPVSAGGASATFLPAAVLVLGALLFKIGAVPFHLWSPDLLAGTRLDRSAVLAVLPKVLGAFAIAHWLLGLDLLSWGGWKPGFEILGLLSAVVGGFGALAQTEARRLLAFSSIAQAGWWLLVLSRLEAPEASATLLFVLLAYAVATAAAFLALQVLCPQGATRFADLGVSTGPAWARGALALAVASLFGLPFLGGMLAKWWAIQEVLWNAGGGLPAPWTLAVLVVSMLPLAGAYWRLVRAARVFQAGGRPAGEPVAPGLAAAVGIAVLLTVLMGCGWPWTSFASFLVAP